MPKKKPLSFEESMVQLESLLESMESGELSLDDSLKAFEQGIGLVRTCQASLNDARERVKILTGENGSQVLREFGGADE